MPTYTKKQLQKLNHLQLLEIAAALNITNGCDTREETVNEILKNQKLNELQTNS